MEGGWLQPCWLGLDAWQMSFTETICILPSSGREGGLEEVLMSLKQAWSGGKEDSPQHKARMPHVSGGGS